MSYLIIMAIIPCSILLATRLPLPLFQRRCFSRYDAYLLAWAWLMLAAIFIIRWSITMRPPLHGIFDTLIIFSGSIIALAVLLGLFYNSQRINPPVAGVVTLLLLYALIHSQNTPGRLPPALQSLWFVPHVLLYFLGYALLAINACASLAYLLAKQNTPAATPKKAIAHGQGEPTTNPELETLLRITLLAGFWFISMGLLIGTLWAKYAWGNYWGWDPKESWALITWLLYLVALHLFIKRKVLNKSLLLFNICIFLVVLFTYFGVKFLPSAASSIHVY